MKAFLCELILSCTLAAPGAKPIDELTYGTVLYDYYQQDYQQALLDTLVAEAQDRQGSDPVRFQLAKGSFAFSDRMYGYARKTFAEVAPAELTDLDRMRLAFHLAREYHRRGDWPAVAEELQKIDLGKTWLGRDRFHPEVEFMRAELAVQNQDFAAAETALARLEPRQPLRAYGLFNLGVAYRQSGDLQAAQRTFASLADMPVYNTEALDLVQRARLALAFIAREQNAPADAEVVLSSLPGSGRYRDVALAAYGGLAMDNQDYELAARIWLTLQKQDYWSSSTAAAQLGFPVSLEKLASQDMALIQYRAAERSFETRLTALNALGQQAEDPAWVRGLLFAFSAPDEDPARMSELLARWREALGHTNWLEWLATQDVHELLLEWRDLLGMKSWLDRLPDQLDAFAEVSQEQQRRSAAARSLLYDQGLLARRDEVAAQVDGMAARLQALRAAPATPSADWMLAMASGAERERIAELDAMRNLIRARMPAGEQGRWLTRIDRLRGVLFWRLVDQSSARLRSLDKELDASRQVLADVDSRIERVRNAQGRFVATVATDYQSFAQRAQQITGKVDVALERHEQALAAELRRGMRRETKEVEQYLLVTRIAIARATDQLAQTTGGAQ